MPEYNSWTAPTAAPATGGFGLDGNGSAGAGDGGDSYWFKLSYANSQAGGGGSSYTYPTLCTDVVHTQSANNKITGYVKLLPA